jgi:hypothetical protein
MNANPHLLSPSRNLSFRTRGSILLLVLCFAALIAISLTSYVALSLNSMKLANRSYYQNSAMNLAEIGIEEAMYCFNRLDEVPKTSPEDAWVPYGWVVSGDTATLTIVASETAVPGTVPGTKTINLAVGPGASAVVKLYCSLYKPTTLTDRPVVVSKATVMIPNAPPTSKYVEVTIRKRSLFPQGMLVRETITGNGSSLTLDSWDSGDDGDPTTTVPITAYSEATRQANATLATNSRVNNSIDIGNGAVYGYISTPGGTVKAQSTAILTGNLSSSEWDTSRISDDFEVVAFPTVKLPTPSYTIEQSTTIDCGSGNTETLPRSTDVAASDGFYYYNFASGANINLKSGDKLTIAGKVVLRLTNHYGVDAINSAGTSGVEIVTGGVLRVYTNGNIKLAGGGGLANANSEPSSCVFFGPPFDEASITTTNQTIDIFGNGKTSMSLFAPDAAITISGGGSSGDFFGALVGKSVVMSGNTRFHYDEALGRLYTGKPYGIAKWRELQKLEERDVYATKL